MWKRRLAAALVCAALVSAPALAQARGAAATGRGLKGAPAETGPGLKALFDESKARARAGAPGGADPKRFETPRQEAEDPQPPNKGMSKRDKVLIIVLVAVFGGVAVWALANRGDGPLPPCLNEPPNPFCQ